MTRIWFNKTLSSVHSVLRMIKAEPAASGYELCASSPNAHASAAANADMFWIEPAMLAGSDYVEWCVAMAKEQAIQLFVPGKDAARISGARDRFEAFGCRVLSAASEEVLNLVNNKAAFYAAVNCPEAPPADWQVVTTLAEFDAAYGSLRLRHDALCIKPSTSVYGIGFRRIREDRSALSLYSKGATYEIDLVSLRTMFSEVAAFGEILVMEYLDGHEYSVDVIADHGVLKCAVARRKPLQPGEGQLIDGREDIQLACRRLVAQFRLNGVVNIQFKEGAGKLRILEINARMSGGIAMACLAGPNLPYLALAGFDSGYERLSIPATRVGLRVTEVTAAMVVP